MKEKLAGWIPRNAMLALLATLIMNTASFVSLPILAIYLAQVLKMNATMVGSILSIILFSSSFLTVITGPLADKIGCKRMIVTGMALRGVGFGGLFFFENHYIIFILSLINGIGAAFSKPSVSAVFGVTEISIRPRIFNLYNQMLNIGVIIGPLIGLLVSDASPKYNFLISGTLFLSGAIIIQSAFQDQHPLINKNVAIKSTLKKVFSDTNFLIFSLSIFMGWLLLAQLNISWPIKASQIGEDINWANLILLINGIIGVIATYALRSVFTRISALNIVIVGFLIISVSFICAGIAHHSINWLILSMIIFTIAEVFLLPGLELKVSEFVDNKTSASYYGVFNIVAGISGIVGNHVGSYMAMSFPNYLIWGVFTIIGIFGTLIAFFSQYFIKTKL